MQGASNNSTGSLIYQAFLFVILFFVPNFVPKILYSQNKRVSFKESKKPPRGWFFFINHQTLHL